MGMKCFMCNLGAINNVRVKVIKTFDEKGRERQETACDECEKIMLHHNHPMNEKLDSAGPEVQGYVKPSQPGQDGYPSVRPS